MNLKITICRDKRNMVKPYVCCWYGELDQGIGDCAEGCNGTGGAHPRSRFWARYTADTTVTISRGYDGQSFPAWVQGIDFSALDN